MTEQYRQIIENASQYGATNNNIWDTIRT
jgi:hypothetical protein